MLEGKIIEAVYKNGVFKPLKEVKMDEGAIIKLKIISLKKIDDNFLKTLKQLQDKTPKVDTREIIGDLRNDRY